MIKANEPIVGFISLYSPNNGNSSEEPEEDPEEVEEDSELEPEEDPVEEVEEDPEEEEEGDPEEEEEEDPEEEPSDYPEEESAVECFNQSLCHNNDETEQLSQDPDEDPSEEYVSEPSSESDTNEADDNRSNGKKRSADVTAFGSIPLQVNQSQKKFRYKEAVIPELDVRSPVTDLQSKSGKQRHSRWEPQPEKDNGISGKRKHSRWEPYPKQDGETGGGGSGNSKRRKTRWASSDDSQLKMLGPLHLPEFRKYFVGSEFDSETLGLQARLFEINKKLQGSEIHDDRPEGERSPSPQPIYNNLGIRINTREVRLRRTLMGERQLIISRLIKKNPIFKTPPKNIPLKLSKKVYIPVKEYPDYNFVGLIMGPRGNTQKRMEKETGARILLRGKGSAKIPRKPDPSDNDELHVYIEAGDQNSLDAAVAMIEKLLIPLEINEHKRAQLQELARLRGTLKPDICHVCKEQGHKAYACPQQPSGLHAIQCDKCGSVRHPTSSCSTVNTKQNPKKETTDDAKLYVGYLPHAVDDNRLRELFSPFGKIGLARVIMDRITGLSKGYGFVHFKSPVEAAAAVMHMNGYQIDGNMLAVRVAGRPPVTGPAAASPSVPSQAAWIGLPGSLPPGAQPSFPNSQGVVMPSAFIYSGNGTHLPNFGVTSFPAHPPAVVLSLGESMNAFSSPSLVAQFPGDPDYPGSEFKQYFVSPNIGTIPTVAFQSDARDSTDDTDFMGKLSVPR